jgi:hypothetical protein
LREGSLLISVVYYLFILFLYITFSYLIDNTPKIGKNVRQKNVVDSFKALYRPFFGRKHEKTEEKTDLGTLYPVEIGQPGLKLIAVQVL